MFPHTQLFDADGNVIEAALDERVSVILFGVDDPPSDSQICSIFRSFSAVQHDDVLASLERIRKRMWTLRNSWDMGKR